MDAHDRVIDYEDDLLVRYRDEYCKFKARNSGRPAPEWAFQIAPAIPFVGQEFGQGSVPQVLIYASAENLSYIWEKDHTHLDWLKDEESQMRRSRLYNEANHGTNIHIGPVNDRTQLKVARHILECLRPSSRFDAVSPENFLEQIAVANPGKYSVFSPTNKDYPKDLKKFREMVPYIRADLDVLCPAILIVPRTIFNTLRHTALKDRLAEVPTVVLISQVQPRPIRTWRKVTTPKDKWCLGSIPYRWNVAAHADQYVQWVEERKESIAWRERIIQL